MPATSKPCLKRYPRNPAGAAWGGASYFSNEAQAKRPAKILMTIATEVVSMCIKGSVFKDVPYRGEVFILETPLAHTAMEDTGIFRFSHYLGGITPTGIASFSHEFYHGIDNAVDAAFQWASEQFWQEAALSEEFMAQQAANRGYLLARDALDAATFDLKSKIKNQYNALSPYDKMRLIDQMLCLLTDSNTICEASITPVMVNHSSS